MTRFLNISTDNTLGGLSPSDEFVASQKAIKEYVDNNSSNVQVDNLTITTNASDEIQAVGVVNKNTAAGAENPIYDWVGTYQEWIDQNIATNHPEWICFITDDTVPENKANVALDNLTSAGKEVCANMSMPSNRYIDLTLGSSGATYTAPGDGYFLLNKSCNGNAQYINLSVNTVVWAKINTGLSSSHQTALIVPVKKGDVLKVDYSATGSTNFFRFYYAQGAQ